MANNKKAQILAAVMCASSVLGGYTVVSAQDYTLTTDDTIVIKASESQTGLTVNHVGDYLQIQGKGKTTPIRIYDDGGFSVQNISIGNDSFRVEKTDVKHDLFKINLNSGEMTASGITVIDENGKNVFSVDQNGTVTSKDDIKASGYSLKNIGAKTAGITRKDEVTTIEGNKLSASGIESVGDVTSTLDGKTYSLNTVGYNTQKIQYSPSQGTLINSSLSAIDIKNANNTFNVDKNGKLEAAIVTSKGDVTSNDGKYSLNNIGEKTEKINVTTNSKNRTTFEFDGKIVASESIEAKHGFITQNGNITTQKGDVTAGEYSLKNIGANTQDFNHVANGITEIKGSLISENGGFYTGTPDAGVAITSEGITVSGEGDVKAGKYSLNDIGVKTAGITREGEVTTIEGNTSISKDGINTKAVNGVSITKVPEISALSNGDDDQPGDIKLDDINVSAIDRNTTAMTYSNGTTSFEGDISATGDVKSGKGYSLDTIGYNTQKIYYSPSQGTLINGTLTVTDIKNANNTFNVDNNGDLKANTVTSKGDVTSTSEDGKTTYSLNKVGEKTSAIDYSQINGESTTSIRGHLVVTDIKNANDTFNVNNNGDLKANTVTSDGDVTSKDGETTYSLNTVGEKVDGLYGTDGDITTLKQKTQAMSYNEDSKTTNFDGNINATGDVTSGNGYSLNKVGEKTSAIDYSQINGESTTSIRGHLVVTDIKNANNTFNVNNNGDLKANTVTSKGDVTSTLDGKTYSLNNIGKQTAGITRDEYGTTTVEGMTSFDAAGMSMGDVNSGSYTAITPGNATFASANNGHTQINGGVVTASEDVKLTDGTSLKGLSTNVGTVNDKIEGIERDPLTETTTIEGMTSFDKAGMSMGDVNSGSYTAITPGNATFASANNGYTQINGGVVTASEDVKLTDGTSLDNIGKQTAGITRDEYGTTTIEGMTSFDAAGMSMGDVNSGSYTAITPGNATFASANKGITQINGGTITTNTIKIGDNIIDDSFFGDIGQTNANTAGITRTEINGDWVTSIEGAIKISESGYISLNADNFGFTYSRNDGTIGVGSLGDLANRVDSLEQKTQGISYDEETGTTTIDGNLSVDGTTGGSTGEGGTTTTTDGNITANTANIGGVEIGDNTVTAQTGKFENIAVGGEGGTTINKDGVTVGNKDNYTSITNNDVVVNNNGTTTSLTDVGNRVTGLESSMNSMNNRINDVEDRIDKVGAMAAAIANLRTMGFDPEAPTEIAIGVGQYKSETGLALGVFHYPNQDFMLSASISTSGDEVMGGIGATWKLGRKSAAEKAKDEEAKRLEKAEDMKKLAQEEKVKAQAERHAKLLAEREAQETA